MNKKGQVLVIFVILLPVLLMIMSVIIDLGLLYIEKRDIKNDAYDAIYYYLNNVDDNVKNDIFDFLNKNIENARIDVKEDNENIIINVKKERKSFSIIKVKNEIDITYKGNKITKEIIKG